MKSPLNILATVTLLAALALPPYLKTKEVAKLIDKAASSEKSEDALRFSQAACNAANAMCAVKVVEAKA